MAVVVTAASGYDLGYVWTNQGAGRQPEKSAGGYYMNAAQAGEPPGRWAGRGAEALGLATGQQVERPVYEKVYRQIHPETGEQMGRKPAGQADHLDHLARLMLAEPHATAGRVLELNRMAQQMTRQAPAYTDVTVSFSKSVSILHASIRENARQARLAGDSAWAAYWDGRETEFQSILQAANRAGLDHMQEWAGFTRTGYHGTKVRNREPGKYESAGMVVTSWLQGTSRDGDMQDHVHNQFARMVLTDADGKWRALDTMSVREQINAMQGIVAAHVEAGLSRAFGVKWEARPDGAGREIAGITRAQIEHYSTRTQTIEKETGKLAAQWAALYGREPNRRELQYIKQWATMDSRQAKEDGPITGDALAEKWAGKWDAKLGADLAGIAPRVTGMGGDGAAAPEGPTHSGPSPFAQMRAMHTALAAAQQARATWSRADLMRAMAGALPDAAQSMDPDAAVLLLHELTERTLAGQAGPVGRARPGKVELLDAPECPPVPDYLRRDLDGRSIYTRPGTERYATGAQLALEERLLATAGQEGAPVLDRAESARLLGATPEALEDAARERAQDGSEILPSGLRLDQAAALHQVVTDPRRVSVIVGPAGSGKTRVLAQAARMWPGPVVGVGPSQAARNVLAQAAGVPAYNTAQILGHTPGARGALGPKALAPGTLILMDEGGMTGNEDMTDLAALAESCSGKVLLAGDHGQLAPVEGGGGMALLARRQGYVQLAEPVRFTAEWEREASLRLRTGDKAVLHDYAEHGRIRGGALDEVMEDARRAYVAGYLEGRDVLLMAQSHDLCRELSQRIRDDLIHLGLVQQGREARLAGGARASAGDLVRITENNHDAGVANGETYRVEAVLDGQVMLRKLVDADRATGERRFADQVLAYRDASTSAVLSYCSTGHSAQGRTVHTGLALITGTEDREWAYTAGTRGTDENTYFVATSPPRLADPVATTRPAPELARQREIERERAGLAPLPAAEDDEGRDVPVRDPAAVLSDVLDRPGAELSALETRDENLANADHLGILHAIYRAEAGPAQTARYEQLVRDRLPTGFADAELGHTAAWLWRSLRSAEAAGLNAGQVLDRAIGRKPLEGSRDVFAVVDARVREDTGGLVPQPAGKWADQVPPGQDERAQYLAALAAAMDDRTARLGEHTAETVPAWALRGLGPVPEDPDGRAGWQDRAAAVAAYREMYGYDDPTEPVGPEPSPDSPEQRAGWHAAFGALARVEGIDVRGLTDGQLWLRRGTYEAETAWAPEHVGQALAKVRTEAADARLAAIRAAAEASAARGRRDHEAAVRHESNAAVASMAQARAREQEALLVPVQETWEAWDRQTDTPRRQAVAADTELRHRHPDAEIPRLRSAEPQPPAPDDQDTTWAKLAAERARVAREAIADRQSVRIPSEDPDTEPDELAWPEFIRRDRDAVLQPPKPDIRPAAALVGEREQIPEAG